MEKLTILLKELIKRTQSKAPDKYYIGKQIAYEEVLVLIKEIQKGENNERLQSF